MSATRRFIAATAGHVDHGKSALVQRLTGIDPDRLREEKRRGITIELGYADLALAGGAVRVGLVDVPGHEDFVKNMVAGVGQVDLAMLVVAADDGWMPQTEEHLQILEYLGARSGIIVITKADLVAELGPCLEDVAAERAGTLFERAPIVPVSSLTGAGFAQLKEAIAAALQDLPPRVDNGKPRLAVDRAFSVAGVGTVITGTLVGGCFRRGDEAYLQPRVTPVRVRAIQTFNSDVAEVPPGSRVALNLASVRPAGARDSARSDRTVRRGDVVTVGSPRVPPSEQMHVVLRRSPRLGQQAPPMEGVARVRVHIATRHLGAHLALSDTAGAGDTVLAALRPDEPVPVLVGDRLVVRDWSQRHTLGGGAVLDPWPPASLRAERQSRFLRAAAGEDGISGFALVTGAPRARGALQALVARDGLVTLSAVDRLLPDATTDIHAAASALRAEGMLAGEEDVLIDRARLQALTAEAKATIDRWIVEQPERGTAPGNLLMRLVASLPHATQAVRLIEEQLRADGFQIENAHIRPPGTTASLPESLRPLLREKRAALSASPLTPPPRRQLAAGAGESRVLEFLVASGEALLLGADVVVNNSAFVAARERIVKHLSRHGEATASELRVAVGTNRRMIIPLLEHLDRDGTTIRVGDRRRLAAR